MFSLFLGMTEPVVRMWYADVDYIRVTTKGGTSENGSLPIYRKMARAAMAEAGQGEVEEDGWYWRGYYGSRGPGCAYGAGVQGALLQASGWTASLVARQDPPWDNIARLDVQYTVWLDDDRPQLSASVADISRDARDMTHGGRWKIRVQEGYGDGNTAYIGTRGGSAYIRVYDKWRESGLDDDYKNAWRFEAELSGAVAASFWPDAGAPWPGPEYWAGVVCSVCAGRGLHLRRPPLVGSLGNPPRYRPATTTESRLAWLRNQVAPSLEKLVAAGVSRETILQSLGLD